MKYATIAEDSCGRLVYDDRAERAAAAQRPQDHVVILHITILSDPHGRPSDQFAKKPQSICHTAFDKRLTIKSMKIRKYALRSKVNAMLRTITSLFVNLITYKLLCHCSAQSKLQLGCECEDLGF